MPDDLLLKPLIRRSTSLLKVVRPVNLLITAAGVWLGASLSDPENSRMLLPVAVVAAMALAAAGNAHNDLKDVDKDRLNRPDRPLPAGLIDRSTLLLLVALALTLGLTALLFLSAIHALVFGLNAAGLFIYNVWGSRQPLIGNLIVSVLVGSTLIFGALETGVNDRVAVAAAFAAAATLARELIKDVQDLQGDRVAGARTFAVLAGERLTGRFVNLVLALLVPGTLLPFILLDFGGTYLLGMGVTCSLLVAASPALSADTGRSSRLLKWAMVSGIVSLLFAESPII